MILLKYCSQYINNFGKLSSGHRTGKDQFSFQSQRRAMPKNVQTTIVALILYASKVMLKILQTRCQQYVNWEIQMYKLGFKEAEDPKIRLPTFVGSKRKWRNFRKKSTSASLTTLKPLTFHIKLWKILREMGIPEYLTCLLRILYAGQEATVRTRRGTTDCFQIRKGVHQGCILSPCLFNFYSEYIMWNAGLVEAQAGIKNVGEISTTSDIPF